MKHSEKLYDNRSVKLFLDDAPQPFGEFAPPVKFTLDTTRIPDGKHQLKIVAKSSRGVEGIRVIPFEVRNGPEIAIVGLSDNEVVDTQVTITVNAYGSETSDQFIINGSETPKAIPAWVWALVISFVAFAIFYLTTHLTPEMYNSFF